MNPRPSRPAALLLAAVLAFVVLRFAAACWWFLASPWTKDYGEGCVLAMAQLLAETGNYFKPLTGTYPLVHGNYPPVFVALTALGQRLVGPTLLVPRLLSVLSTFAMVWAMFALLRRRGADTAIAVTFALLSLAPWFVVTWAPMGRVDMLALFLSLLGLLLWDRHGWTPGGKRYLAFACFALAFYTKQNALLAPAAVFADLLLDRERRRALPGALAAFVAPVVIVFVLLAALTGGESYRHLVPYTAAAEYSVPHALRSYRAFLVLTAPLLALLLPAAAARVLPAGSRVLVFYWLLNLAALATIAKAGAGQNYFIEPWLATLLLSGVTLAELCRVSPAVSRAWPAFALVAAGLAVAHDADKARLPQAIRNPSRATEFAELDAAVRAAPGPVLSENLALLVLAGRPAMLEPFGYGLLSKTRHVDPAPLVADCNAAAFSLIVYENRFRDIPGFGACLDNRYELTQTLGPYELYRPKTPGP